MEINSVNVNYIQYGEGKDIVLLHGWGQNIEMMKPIGDRLAKHFKITIIDLPGYGGSTEPTYPWEVSGYVEMLKVLFDNLKIDNPILIGHSFGGRIAIIYSSRYAVEKLVLLGAPCIRKEEKISFKVKILKSLKMTLKKLEKDLTVVLRLIVNLKKEILLKRLLKRRLNNAA